MCLARTWPTNEDDVVCRINEVTPMQMTNKSFIVIVGLYWEATGGHWVVVIGYEADEHGEVANFLVLDPAFEAKRTQLWNAVLSARPVKPGPKPYAYWSETFDIHDRYCQISEAIFLEPAD